MISSATYSSRIFPENEAKNNHTSTSNGCKSLTKKYKMHLQKISTEEEKN
jgi:hypothetical protein